MFRSSDSTFRLVEMDPFACRHGFGQKHDLRVDWPAFSMCSISGTFDLGKHRKIVSRTARELARTWISSHCPQATPSILSADEEETEAAASEVSDEGISRTGTPVPPIAEAFSGSFTTGFSSPPGQVRTGFRIHNLTYLLGVWERAPVASRAYALRAAAMELESGADVFILHLCGCGLCLSNSAKNDGCVEPSHLRTGDKRINDLHTQYHSVLRQSSPANYRPMRAAIRADCEGAFGLL